MVLQRTLTVQTGKVCAGKTREQIVAEVTQAFSIYPVVAVQVGFDIVRVTFRDTDSFKLARAGSHISLFGSNCVIQGGGPPPTMIHVFDYPAELGDEVVRQVLSNFGDVKSVRRQKYIGRPDIETGTRLVLLTLKATPPRGLFIGNYFCRLWYKGQPLVCNLCGTHGHKSVDCPNKDKCRRCGQSGHFARSCPNPWAPISRVESTPSVDFPDLGSSVSAPPPSPGAVQGDGVGPSVPVVSPSSGDINLSGSSTVGRAVDEACDTFLSSFDLFGDIASVSDDSDNESHVSVDSYLSVTDSLKDYSSGKNICKDNIRKDVSCGNNISKDISNGNGINMDTSDGNDISVDSSGVHISNVSNDKNVSNGAAAHAKKVSDNGMDVSMEESTHKNLSDNINGGVTNNHAGPDSHCVVNDSVNSVAGVISKPANDLVGLAHDGDVICGANSSSEAEPREPVVNNAGITDNVVSGRPVNSMEGNNIGNETQVKDSMVIDYNDVNKESVFNENEVIEVLQTGVSGGGGVDSGADPSQPPADTGLEDSQCSTNDGQILPFSQEEESQSVLDTPTASDSPPLPRRARGKTRSSRRAKPGCHNMPQHISDVPSRSRSRSR